MSSSFRTPWTVACQVPLSMGFPGKKYYSGLPFPSPGDIPNPGIELRSPALQEDSLLSEPPGKPHFILWNGFFVVVVMYTCSLFYFILFSNLFFFFTLFYFTILYWFCHTLTWIHHGCTWVPNPEPPLPPPTPYHLSGSSPCMKWFFKMSF